MKLHFTFALILLCLTTQYACSFASKKQPKTVEKTPETMAFSGDSAYEYVRIQTKFGPRVPETKAHQACREYLIKKLLSFGAQASFQESRVQTWDGSTVPMYNITASINPAASKRILLCAHWDSRPWADQDPNPDNHRLPVLGANDGASGVGVILEIIRQVQLNAPEKGLDVVFFDVEDMGTPTFVKEEIAGDFWCLGSKYWSKKAKESGYRAEFGILLDMVGGVSPKFYQEQHSTKYALWVVNQVWSTAARLGYGQQFIAAQGGAIIDDHLPVNEVANIPCIDIIDYNPQSPNGFVPQWHTVEDNMNHISKQTLEAVGKTLMQVIYAN